MEKAEATLSDLLTKNPSGELAPLIPTGHGLQVRQDRFCDGTLIVVGKMLLLSTPNWFESALLIRRGRRSTIRSSKVRHIVGLISHKKQDNDLSFRFPE